MDSSLPPTTIQEWKENVHYLPGNIVVYIAAFYECLTENISSQANSPAVGLGSIWAAINPPPVKPPPTTTSIWDANTSYVSGNIVIFEGGYYKCIQDHVSNISWTPPNTLNILWTVEQAPPITPPPITEPPIIIPPTDPTGPVTEWTPNVSYIINNFVIYYDNAFYRCVRPHVSSEENAPTVDAYPYVYWVPASPSELPPPQPPAEGIQPWTIYTAYTTGVRVIFDDDVFQCNKSHVSTRANSPADPKGGFWKKVVDPPTVPPPHPPSANVSEWAVNVK